MKRCHRFDGWESPYRELVETYMIVGRLHRLVLERQLNRTGVYRSQHQLLMYIADNPNASQKEIAQLNHVSPATVAVSLKKLENGGYIRRVVDEHDNRYNKICITEKGRAVVENSVRWFQKVERTIFDGFAPEEMAAMQGYLNRMQQNLNSLMPETEREELE